MDEVDSAALIEEKILELHIKAARGIPLSIEGDGYCLNCGDKVGFGRFCDVDCRNDWARR